MNVAVGGTGVGVGTTQRTGAETRKIMPSASTDCTLIMYEPTPSSSSRCNHLPSSSTSTVSTATASTNICSSVFGAPVPRRTFAVVAEITLQPDSIIGGTGVGVGGTAVAVGVLVGSGVLVGGTGVAVGSGVSVGTGVAVGSGVSVGVGAGMKQRIGDEMLTTISSSLSSWR